ncbi:MAG TPA: peptidase domain-containing ABC transporter [Kineosporiaceae bacterium]
MANKIPPTEPGRAGKGSAARRHQGPRRVPVILSETLTECGAACLAMVLSYYGRRTERHETAERCGIGRDGANALTLASVARSYGLEVTPLGLKNLNGLSGIALPAILYWSFNHFVVLERFGPKGAIIVDPARGRVKVSMAELDRRFTGVLLTLAPGPEFRPRGRQRSAAQWSAVQAALRVKGVRGLFAKVLLASALLTALGLVAPFTMALVVGQVIPSGRADALPKIAISLALFVVAHGLVEYIYGMLLLRLQQIIDRQLLSSFFEHLLKLPLEFFQARASGDLFDRMTAIRELRTMITDEGARGLLDVFLVVLNMIILVLVSPVLALVVLGFATLEAAIALLPTRRMLTLILRELMDAGKLGGFTVESIKGIDSLKAGGHERWAGGRWAALFDVQQAAVSRRARFSVTTSSVLNAASEAAPLALLIVGAHQVLSREISLGAMVGILALAGQVLQPVARLTRSYQRFLSLQGHLIRLQAVLDARTEPGVGPSSFSGDAPAEPVTTDPAAGSGNQVPLPRGRRSPLVAASPSGHDLSVRIAPRLTGRIDLVDVGVRHLGSQSWALRHIALGIPAGAHVALVGRTGSGKSTLLKSILGLYEPAEGTILFDGHDLRTLDRASVRRQCGVVTQEVTVFQGTIRQNITLGNSPVSTSTIQRAARLAELDEDIRAMPMGYETQVAEHGTALSGGQRQRLALARALVGDPVALFLDEATSALDPTTQARISRNLAELNITMVSVAHRLSTVEMADVVVVLDKGRIVEIGDHSSLQAQGGIYAEMLASSEAGTITPDPRN